MRAAVQAFCADTRAICTAKLASLHDANVLRGNELSEQAFRADALAFRRLLELLRCQFKASPLKKKEIRGGEEEIIRKSSYRTGSGEGLSMCRHGVTHFLRLKKKLVKGGRTFCFPLPSLSLSPTFHFFPSRLPISIFHPFYKENVSNIVSLLECSARF